MDILRNETVETESRSCSCKITVKCFRQTEVRKVRTSFRQTEVRKFLQEEKKRYRLKNSGYFE